MEQPLMKVVLQHYQGVGAMPTVTSLKKDGMDIGGQKKNTQNYLLLVFHLHGEMILKEFIVQVKLGDIVYAV